MVAYGNLLKIVDFKVNFGKIPRLVQCFWFTVVAQGWLYVRFGVVLQRCKA
jgi:hypothetical protein